MLAHGRDPYFPPWPDVVQLNPYAAATRTATEETLADIASQCDGIRCDMAMLMTNDIVEKTWGDRAGPAAGAGVLARDHRRAEEPGTRTRC